MTRQGRSDYPDAIHLVRVEGTPGGAIFFDAQLLRDPEGPGKHASDLRLWEFLIARACDRHGARVHAFAWMPNVAVLLLQRFAVPLDVVLASVLGQYSRHLHNSGRVPRKVLPYRARYGSIVITPGSLPYAVRHVYWQPVDGSLCDSPTDYPFCSYELHCGASTPPLWFCRRDFLVGIRQRGYVGRAGCERFLVRRESARHIAQFTSVSRGKARILGEFSDVEEALWQARNPHPTLSVEQISDAVEGLLGKSAATASSVMKKSLVTWYATRNGAATLEEMGRLYHRRPTTLRRDIESHRASRPELFGQDFKGLSALIQYGKSSPATNVSSAAERTRTKTPAQGKSARDASHGVHASWVRRSGFTAPRGGCAQEWTTGAARDRPPPSASTCLISDGQEQASGGRTDELMVSAKGRRRKQDA